MRGLGTKVRLNRIFSHPTGRLFSIAIDHFVGYERTLQDGLADLPRTISELMTASPDAMTMFSGVARTCWSPYAGKAALIVQAGCFTPDDRVCELLAGPEEVVRLGGDAIAVSIGVRGDSEGRYLRMLADVVREAEQFELPVIAHVYPRAYKDGVKIVTDPDNVAWATRCGVECGADVIKVAYTGDIESFAAIVSTCPVPLVAAGGPRAPTLSAALTLAETALACGARGITVGRNVWSARDPAAAALAFATMIRGDGGDSRVAPLPTSESLLYP